MHNVKSPFENRRMCVGLGARTGLVVVAEFKLEDCSSNRSRFQGGRAFGEVGGEGQRGGRLE